MRVLITGGAGFIGSSLCISLLKDGHDITVLDNLSEQVHGENPDLNSSLYLKIKGKVNFIKGSVTDVGVWAEAIKGQEAIIHMASETGTGQSMYELHKYVEVNIGGTAKMLEYLEKNSHSVRKILVASSRALYGEGRYINANGQFIYPPARKLTDLKKGIYDLVDETGKLLSLTSTDESSLVHPTSVYGITKQAQEQLVMTVSPSAGIIPVALRYQNVFGPGQSLANPYTGILSIFSTRILHNREILIFEDGNESRDFVYIDDVVSATHKALISESADGQIFGIGSGIPTSVIKAAKTLMEKLNIEVGMRVTGEFRVGDIRHNYADLNKAKNILGYQPQFNFEEGISEFVEWVKRQPIQQDNYDKSIGELRNRGLFKCTE